jgi:hypothetical protein
MKYLCILSCFLFLLPLTTLSATPIKGKIIDSNGEVLSFASIHVEGTSIGTTSNLDGFYNLELEEGTHQLVFQYVGYIAKIESVTIGKETMELNVSLKPLVNSLQEVVITAGEDPAYRVIRKAIKKRKFYLNQRKEYSCDTYVKGKHGVSVDELPSSFMGVSLETDSTDEEEIMNPGIIYLSESLSRLHYKGGNYKEVMTFSKVSGNDKGFSFNSGRGLAKLSFYQNTIKLNEAQILSPIAANALTAYKYRMETSFYDEKGHLVYKIEVLPKNKLGAVVGGYIYIVDGDWAIHSTDLFTTGKSTNISLLDTLHFRETHIKLDDKTWTVFSRNLTFTLKVFFIKLNGYFASVFSNYDLNPKFDRKFFNAEVFKVEDQANKQGKEAWDSIRPVPLGEDEVKNYYEKDSLQKIYNTKEYKDSMDQISNRFNIMDLVQGYAYQNTHQNYKFTVAPLFQMISFNTVQGLSIGLGLGFEKVLNVEKYQWFKVNADAGYSFSDRQFRGTAAFEIRFSAIGAPTLKVEGGRKARQFNGDNPIMPIINTSYSLIWKLNYLKLYDDFYTSMNYSHEVFNGFYVEAGFNYGNRMALVNTTDYSFAPNNSREYFSNHPQDIGQPNVNKNTPSFLTHQYLEVEMKLRIRLGQKYVTYPNRRIYKPSQFPDIWISYKKGIPIFGESSNYDYLELKFEKEKIALGTSGLFSFSLTGGWFVNRQKTYFMDYYHFNGNQTFLAKKNAYLKTFQLLPYYENSTNSAFGMLHMEHNFNGAIWNKIPGLKALGFEFIAGYHLLYTPENQEYMEFNIGLDRIGWELFRVLRVDFVMGYKIGEPLRYGAVVGFNFSL